MRSRQRLSGSLPGDAQPGTALLDRAIADWTGTLTSGEVLRILDEASVPCGPIYSVADMFADPHYQARGMFERVDVNGKPLAIPALVPRLRDTPGRTDWAGPELGAHNDEVLGGLLGLDEGEMEELRARGVI